MSQIQAVLNEFMPCGGNVCPGCEEACTSSDGRTPDADRMADAIIELRQRAEAAEAEREKWESRAMSMVQFVPSDILARDLQQAAHEFATLRAEREALRKDAARLDWLESRSSFLVHQWQGGGYTLTLPQPPVDGVRPPPIGVAGDAFRQAIDAAMAVQPTTSTGPNT